MLEEFAVHEESAEDAAQAELENTGGRLINHDAKSLPLILWIRRLLNFDIDNIL